MSKIIEKLTVKKALLATGFFLVMLWLIDYSPIGVAGLLQVTDGVSILDYETRYTVDFAYNFLKSMGQAGRLFHLTRIMPLDFVYPPSLMLFMFSWLGLLLKKTTQAGSKARYINILPIIYLILDFTENAGIIAMLLNYPTRLAAVCFITGWVTSIKKTVVLLIIIAVMVELVIFAIKGIKGLINAKTKG